MQPRFHASGDPNCGANRAVEGVASRASILPVVNHDIVARGNVSLRLGHRLMSGASRSEAVAMLGKRRVPSLLKNLQHGLLDQSVDDARHAELSDPAVRLGDFDPLDRLWLA